MMCQSIELDIADLKAKMQKYCSRSMDGSYGNVQFISVRSTCTTHKISCSLFVTNFDI